MKVHNPSNLKLIDYRKLVGLQTESLKDLTEENYKKLGKSFELYGYRFPADVWFDGDTPYIVDAHQRIRYLTKENIQFENTGYEIPYVEIEAKDKEEAKKLLLVRSSQYGTIDVSAFQEFIVDLPEAEIISTTNFDAFNIPKPDNSGEDQDKVECPTCGTKVDSSKIK